MFVFMYCIMTSDLSDLRLVIDQLHYVLVELSVVDRYRCHLLYVDLSLLR